MFEPTTNSDRWHQWLFQEIEEGSSLASYDTIENYLRHGTRLRLQNGIRIIQCLIMPSFEDWVSYEIFQWRDRNYYVLETQCKLTDPRGDLNEGEIRRIGFVPQLRFKHSQLNKSTVEDFKSFFDIPVKVFPENYHGLDGTLYELLLCNGFQEVRFRWWVNPTDEWLPLEKGFYQVVKKCQDALKDTP